MLQKRDRLFLRSLKNESHLKNIQKQIKSSNRSWRAKNYSLVKPRKSNNFIVKFQNLKQIVIIRVNQKEINVKINLKQIKSNFFSRKIWHKSHQSFSTIMLGSWEI